MIGNGWGGAYLGLHGGLAIAGASGQALGGPTAWADDAAWGGHAGWGLGLGPIYAGIEADATWGGARYAWQLDPLYSSRLGVDWTSTVRARLGVIAGGVLVYGTAGAVWSGETIGQHRLGAGVATATHRSSGLAVGAGLEVRPLPSVSLRLEALNLDFSDRGAALARTLPSGVEAPRSWRGDLGDTIVRAGVSLRLH